MIKFVGYVICNYVTDEYLLGITESDYGNVRQYGRSPGSALVFFTKKDAWRVVTKFLIPSVRVAALLEDEAMWYVSVGLKTPGFGAEPVKV